MRVRGEREEATRVDGEHRERGREVEPFRAAVQLDGHSTCRGGRENARPVRADAAPHVVETALRVAQDRDAGRLDGPHEAGRLVARAPEIRMDRRDDGAELGHAPRRQVERAVLGDVRLRAEEHRESRVGSRVQEIDLAPLRAEVGGIEAARNGAVARMVRKKRIAVPPALERAMKRGEGHPAVGAVGVEVEVAAQIRPADPTGRRENPVGIRA
jgi:hypothetical protein